MIRDWPGLTLRLAAARDWDGSLTENVFVLGGPHETRVTVVSQQVRAINLAVALHRTGRLAGKTIGVVGAGAAGATFAAAAGLFGADVTLFDEHEEPISTQRWSFDRYLHPNLFDWPVEGWDEPRACLPVVDWEAGPSAKVRLHMLVDFALAASKGSVKWCSQHSVSEVCPDGDTVKLSICDLRSTVAPDVRAVRVAVESFDLVIVATGFLPEPKVESTAVSGTYWQDRRLTDVIDSAADDHTIVGDGDGALTELLRLTFEGSATLEGFHQSSLITIAAALSQIDGVAADVLAVEAGISGKRGGSTLQTYADERFSAVRDMLAKRLRPDPYRVEVRTGRVTAMRNSFALNRFLAAQLISLADVRFRLGHPISKDRVTALAPSSVIWRAGYRHRQRTVLVEPALSVRDAGDALARDPSRQDVIGTVDDLMDASRERRWGEDAVTRLSERSAGSALKAAATLEKDGLAASRGFGWKSSVWPAFVDETPKTKLIEKVLDLARIAFAIDNDSPPMLWSNFHVTHEEVRLSLDLVAASVSLTPTEVVDALRRHSQPGIELKLVQVERGTMELERVWLRVELDRLIAHDLPILDWNTVSLLLAPGFAQGDSFHGDGVITFEWHAPPTTGHESLDKLVRRMLAERAVVMALPITDAATEEVARDDTLFDAACAGQAGAEEALLTVAHRRLGGADAFEFRLGLVELARLAASPSLLVHKYLTRVLRADGTNHTDALLSAAFGPLARRDPTTGKLEPLLRHDARLREHLPEDLNLRASGSGAAGALDLSAFAVYVVDASQET
ncbi:hypothetical protein OJ998_22295 [Solirubrobacter taibaiensis]|nr:hypothetical protein [Solirubrobacter taibaiensis]